MLPISWPNQAEISETTLNHEAFTAIVVSLFASLWQRPDHHHRADSSDHFPFTLSPPVVIDDVCVPDARVWDWPRLRHDPAVDFWRSNDISPTRCGTLAPARHPRQSISRPTKSPLPIRRTVAHDPPLPQYRERHIEPLCIKKSPETDGPLSSKKEAHHHAKKARAHP